MIAVEELDEWRLRALCRSGAVDMYSANTEALRLVCHACPERMACLQYAIRAERGLGVKYRHGMWGGRTPRERAALDRRVRRAQQPIQHGSSAGATAHRRRGEEVCGLCLHAEAQDTAERRAKARNKREGELSCR